MKKVCVVTGARAEYGLLRWVIEGIQDSQKLDLQIIATGMHLSPEFGLTYREIEEDGFQIDRKVEMVLSADTPSAITKSIGLGLIGFGDVFSELQPDIVVLLGDRYELLAAATAAMVSQIAIAHIHGGETTEGAVDEAIRHSITKMAWWHFVAAAEYEQRVAQLGELPQRIFNVGALGVDGIKRTTLLSKAEVIAKTGLFVTKKRYGLKIINDAGRKVNKIHVKGLDTIRSNFALAMKNLLSKVLEDILANVPKDKIDERIMKFKRNMNMLHYDVMANPIGVKGIGKYEVKDTDSPFSTFKKGAPVHVKAAINYNSLLEHWYEGRKYEKITNSTKIKWVYLKDNEFGFDTIAYKGYEDPPQILDLIKNKIDHNRMYDQAMTKKIGMFYDSMGWEAVVDKQQSIERFF